MRLPFTVYWAMLAGINGIAAGVNFSMVLHNTSYMSSVVLGLTLVLVIICLIMFKYNLDKI